MGQLRAISLFTGAGGLDFGFEAAGFETAVAIEVDQKCIATLRSNRDWPVIPRDIARVNSKAILATASLGVGEADVLIGGPPCQPFSKSGFWANGDAARLNDPRARTLSGYIRVLQDTLPKAFLLENVEGLGFRRKDEALSFICRELNRINLQAGTSYSPSIAVLNAADYGVPQTRRRLFIIGSRDKTEFRFPASTHVAPETLDSAKGEPHMTAWDAMWDVASEDPSLALRGKWSGLLPSIPEGHNYLWHTDRGGGEPLFGWRRRYWNFLLKLAKNRPAWTLQAQPGPATGPFHWENRRLSAREMARLQTFPDSIRIPDLLADAQRQIGNAVPSLLAEVLAREIRAQLLGSSAAAASATLALRRGPPLPAAQKPEPVPTRYLSLRGAHSPHPGSGRGYRALMLDSTLNMQIAAE
jgi:DNA (cytosine-5)-methyltransferase 1